MSAAPSDVVAIAPGIITEYTEGEEYTLNSMKENM